MTGKAREGGAALRKEHAERAQQSKNAHVLQNRALMSEFGTDAETAESNRRTRARML